MGTTYNRYRGCERGAAFIEFVIVIPMLILFLIFCFELGRIFNHYMILSEIAYEGTRLGSQLDGMRPSCFNTAAVKDLGWIGEPETLDLVPHYIAQNRTVLLLKKYKETNYLTVYGPTDANRGAASGEPILRSQYIRRVSGDDVTDYYRGVCVPGADDVNTFGVRIEATYEPLVFSIAHIPIKAESRGPFLYNNNKFFIRRRQFSEGGTTPP